MPEAGGKWNTYEITAQGSRFVVVLSGQKTTDAQDPEHASGNFALQYGAGVVKFRKVQIKPLQVRQLETEAYLSSAGAPLCARPRRSG